MEQPRGCRIAVLIDNVTANEGVGSDLVNEVYILNTLESIEQLSFHRAWRSNKHGPDRLASQPMCADGRIKGAGGLQVRLEIVLTKNVFDLAPCGAIRREADLWDGALRNFNWFWLTHSYFSCLSQAAARSAARLV
jgi:hypothetical protein